MKKIFVSVVSLISAIFQFTPWFLCKRLAGIFHLSLYEVSLNVEGFIHNDSANIPFAIVRIFHNKITVFVIEFFSHFTRFWDINFLANFLSMSGYFGLIWGLYYGARRKNKTIGVIVLCLFVLEIIGVMVEVRTFYHFFITIIWLLYQCISLYGLLQYIQIGNLRVRVIFLIFLILLSFVWHFVFLSAVYHYCVKI